MSPDLIILGAGAAGLYAACAAADAGLRGVLVERRHRPGLKLLMCGNNRCNLAHAGTPEELLEAYGEPVASFLSPALQRLPVPALRRRFDDLGLPTRFFGDRLYPASQRGDDVLHAFLDRLRDREFPILFNCPAEAVRRERDGFTLECRALELRAPRVLLCVGGCSYPKTGSVGDGFRFAEDLGLATVPPRPGLAGLELPEGSPFAETGAAPLEIPDVVAAAPNLGKTRGNLLFERGILRGSAIFDLTRRAARQNQPVTSTTLDLLPEAPARRPARGASLAARLNALGLPMLLAQAVARLPDASEETIHRLRLDRLAVRPLKEAIVTVGGIALDEFDPETLQAKRVPGLYAAGEVLDVDGPTGGFNLHAAFATADLAIRSMASRREPRARTAPRQPATPPKRASSWGPHFWDQHRDRFRRPE